MTHQAGYIITDNNGTIQGFGLTADDAWRDAKRTYSIGRITMLSDDEDATEQMENNWVRRSDLEVLPASAALLAEVEIVGCALAWTRRNGLAVTRDEADDEDRT